MSETVDRATVAHVARLAKLTLTDSEAERMQRDLAQMLAYVERLQKLDTTNIEPMTGPLDRDAPLAQDEPHQALTHEALTRMAPKTYEAFVAVPKILGGEQ